MFRRTISPAELLMYFTANLAFTGVWFLATDAEPPLWARLAALFVCVATLAPAERALARRHARRVAARRQAREVRARMK
ncbi:hypothetical protein [Streptomyces nigrescens]|uniref:hypothetical protein n=1 Tax=Streptomyces nigrescens TaxID=1920 RepID=UPI0036F5549D